MNLNSFFRIGGRAKNGSVQQIKTDNNGRLDVVRSSCVRVPKEPLIFTRIESFPSWDRMAVSDDGTIFFIRYNNKFSKISDISDIGTLTEGVSWNANDWGMPVNIAVTPYGLCVATKDEATTPMTSRLLFFEDINDDSPVIAKEIQSDGKYFAAGMGFHYVGGGRKTGMVLVGEYGNNDNSEHHAYLSLDGGQTFTTVFTHEENPSANNVHIHDVAISPFNGHLWISLGDDSATNGIYRSVDLGATWTKLETDILRKPTVIMPFIDRVVFGRDEASLKPGFDYYQEPISISDWNIQGNVVHELRSILPTGSAGHTKLFPMHKRMRGMEGYCNVPRRGNSIGEYPGAIWATGDGGASIHPIHVNVGADADMIIRGITDSLLICSTDSAVYTAPRPVWVER